MMGRGRAKARLDLIGPDWILESINIPKLQLIMRPNILIILTFFLTQTGFLLEARIGDDRLTLEKRLLRSGGYQYRDEQVLANRRKGMPYIKFEEYFPDRADLRIYYKTTDGRKPLSKDIKTSNMLEGWNLHVLYVQGKSVLEIYKRSEKISEFEFIHLLNLQSNGSFWEKKSDKELEDNEYSTFGFELQRNDKMLRAKKIGSNAVMVFSSGFDHLLKKTIRDDQMENAPSSTDGF
ncbi:MAG: hypothetical protein EBU27_01745 [Opitutae bacterium]|nr:hypothetical protein [Opitutae bacterium]